MCFPKGFNDPEMLAIAKKHKTVVMSKELFSKTVCSNIHTTADNMVNVITASSMVAMFEKPQ